LQAHGDDAEGICIASPQRNGEACNSDFHCADTSFCSKTNSKDVLGVCTRKAKLNEACSGYSSKQPAPPCASDLGCYYEDENKPGVCLKKDKKVGEKCNFDVTCKNEGKELFCKHADRSAGYGACQPYAKAGEKCTETTTGTVYGTWLIPCGVDLDCKFEKDQANGVCVNHSSTVA